MAGKTKYAERLAKHLNSPIDAACLVAKPGSTTATAVTGGIGGAVGAAAATAASRRGDAGDGEIKMTGNGWLALGPDAFALVKGDLLLGKPKGEPIAEVAYAEVAGFALKQGKMTTRADVALADGRTFAFEAKRLGANKPNVEVLELLRERCA
jgi:hypothetical protein